MKRLKLYLLLLSVCVGVGCNLSAQSIIKDAIMINNLKGGERYTQEQFVQALGTPSKIRFQIK